MRHLLGAWVMFALLVVACGGEPPAASGGAGGGGGGGGADLPAASSVMFGASYDPVALTVGGKVTSAKAGTPLIAVGRAFTPQPAGGVVVKVGSGSSNKPERPPTATNNPENADLFAIDLSGDALTPGTWVVSFTTPAGKILASGFLTVTP
ncbi:MAG: hypothetical protein H0U52_12295 [Chloroflexi bacterium]|nr:hypothetical protein [Chloroflexota bacterium]